MRTFSSVIFGGGGVFEFSDAAVFGCPGRTNQRALQVFPCTSQSRRGVWPPPHAFGASGWRNCSGLGRHGRSRHPQWPIKSPAVAVHGRHHWCPRCIRKKRRQWKPRAAIVLFYPHHASTSEYVCQTLENLAENRQKHAKYVVHCGRARTTMRAATAA